MRLLLYPKKIVNSNQVNVPEVESEGFVNGRQRPGRVEKLGVANQLVRYLGWLIFQCGRDAELSRCFN